LKRHPFAAWNDAKDKAESAARALAEAGKACAKNKKTQPETDWV